MSMSFQSFYLSFGENFIKLNVFLGTRVTVGHHLVVAAYPLNPVDSPPLVDMWILIILGLR